MDTHRLLQAVDFAANKHRNQRRKNEDKTPYINHPVDVAFSLSKAGITDVNILIAALLHDTIEDTDTSYDEIVNAFGPDVAVTVKEVTDDKSLPKAERKRLQIEHALVASRAAKLVKLADKLSNLKDLLQNPPTSWSKQEISGYAVWSHAVVRQMHGTNDFLEQQLKTVFDGFGINGLGDTELESILETYYANMVMSE